MSEEHYKPGVNLTFETVHQDGERLLKLVQDDKTTKICLDLSSVKHCDSAGLALLIEVKRMCHQYHKGLIFKRMPKAIVGLADFCGVRLMLENESPPYY